MVLPVAGSALMSVLELPRGSYARTVDLKGLARLCSYPFSIDISLRLLEKRLVVELSGVSPVAWQLRLPSSMRNIREASAMADFITLTCGTE